MCGKKDAAKGGKGKMNSLSIRRLGQGPSYNKGSGKMSPNNSGNMDKEPK